MAAGMLPYLLQAFTDINGTPLANGLLYSYTAGTLTPQSLYTDSALSVAFTNPIVLTSTGRISGAVFTLSNIAYKLKLTDSSGVVQPNWPIDNVLGALTSSPLTQTIATTGTTTALTLPTNPYGLPSVTVLNNPSLLTVQGIAAGVDGQQAYFISAGAGLVTFAHQNGSANAPNRLINLATSAPTSLAAGSGTALYEYDATNARWRLVVHEQGAWITPTFAAGNFTAAASMTWGVGSGDVLACAYRLSGRTLFVVLELQATTVGGTPSNELRMGSAAYGGFTQGGYGLGQLFYNDNAAGFVTGGLVQAAAAATFLGLYKSNSSNWSAATDATAVRMSIVFEVT